MDFKKKWYLPEWLTAGLAFVYYWIMALYKLMDASIWQDEAMEFYCSIPVKGAIRGVTEYATMYERMAYIQQQPPLYNWLMCIWLQISENEWWYRFSSVVFGFGATIGLYMVIRKLCNHLTAALSVVTFSSIYIWMYYVKEASEYSVLIMLLFWMVYLYLRLLEKATLPRILGMTLLCVMSVYTHYSAAFIVVPLALQLLVHDIRQKDWFAVKTAGISYVAAGIGAGLPLLYFFVLPQTTNAISTLGTKNQDVDITGEHLIRDFFESMMWVLRWCMTDYDRDWEIFTPVMWCLVFAIILAGIICYRFTKRREIRFLLRLNTAIYLIYYIPTILRIYAYGWFGNRYNLFILPIWFVTIVAIVYELLQIIKKSDRKWMKKLSRVMLIAALVGTLLFCCYGVKRINDHWAKGDQRNLVQTWYDEKAYEADTFVNFHTRYAFMYYVTHNKAFDESYWEHLVSNMNLDSLQYSDEEWIQYLETEVYPNGIPEELYVVSGQRDTIVNALESVGYEIIPVLDGNTKLFLCREE